MSVETEAAISDLVAAYPQLALVLAEHLEDNFGEVLPYLVMSDVVRSLVADRHTDTAVCASILDWMETTFRKVLAMFESHRGQRCGDDP